MSEFMDIYRGLLEGMLTADAYRKLVDSVRDGSWHSLEYSDDGVFRKELSGEEVQAVMKECLENVQKKNLVSTEHPYTYAKNPEDPVLIKIYDPMKCGSSCSVTAPLPWFVLSRLKPDEEDVLAIFPQKKKKLFGLLGSN